MIQELSDESRRLCRNMNIAKTKVVVVENTTIHVDNVLIENIQCYVYLGQHYIIKGNNHDKEIQQESWQAVRHTPNTGISVKATLSSA